MIIKNIFINDKDVYIDELIKELIRMNISYVLVDNFELIFDNYIIRFYEKEGVIELFNEGLLSIPEQETVFGITDSFEEKKSVPKMNKRMIKEQNKKYNQMYKNGRR